MNNRWVIVDIEDNWKIIETYLDQAEAREACEEMNAFANQYVVMYL